MTDVLRARRRMPALALPAAAVFTSAVGLEPKGTTS